MHWMCAALVLAASQAPSPSPSADSVTAPAHAYRHDENAPVVRAARTTGPIRVDGALDDPAWAAAAPFTDFIQRDPREGRPATERTELRVLVDDDALYVGARMYDHEPSRIRRPLARRDEGTDSDYLQVSLDTFHDHLTDVFFLINPAGAVSDGVTYSNGNNDTSWDPVWEAAARVDSLGWTAEMRIPLSQLHYNARADAVWGIQVTRLIQRTQETDLLAFTPKKEQAGVSRYGHLTGLGRLPSHRHVELVPYTLARASYSDIRAGDPFRSGRDYHGSMGVDAKYDVTRDLTLAGTVNPDFGQAEVDPAVVNLSAFETFFPEKRPFFVEGADDFSFGHFRSHNSFGYGNLYYTRRIGRPPHLSLSSSDYAYLDAPDNSTIAAAAKLTGRTSGGWTLGFLDAVTARERARFVALDGARGQAAVEPPTNYFVGRVRRDFNQGQTTVGGLLTAVDRNLDDPQLRSLLRSGGYLLGLDFNHSWKERAWSLDGYLAGSYVTGDTNAIAATQLSSAHYFQRPDASHVQFDPRRTSLSGYQGALALAKNSGEHWMGSLTTQFMSPGFEVNDLGFESRADRFSFSTIAIYSERRPGRLFRNYALYPYTYHEWNYGGKLVTQGYAAALEGLFANYWSISPRFTLNPPTWNDQLTRGGPITRTGSGKNAELAVESDSRKAWSVSTDLSFGWNDYGFRGDTYSLSLSLRPRPGFQIKLGPEFDYNHIYAQYLQTVGDPQYATATYGNRYVFATLEQKSLSLVTRLNWTFSPKASLQIFVQPLVSSQAYRNFKELRLPGTFDFDLYGVDRGSIRADSAGDYRVDPDGPGPAAAFLVGKPDFNFRSLRGNAVLRWEYRPGSTFFLIWQQTRQDESPTGSFEFGRDMSALFSAKPENILMAKLTTWFGL